MPKILIAKYQELLDILSKLRVTDRFDELSGVIDEATALCSLSGTPRIKVEGYGPLPITWSEDWYAVRFDRRLPILGYYRDRAGKPVFYVTPRRIVDLFGRT